MIEISSNGNVCPICLHEYAAGEMNKHHLVPKSRKGKVTILVCRNCHRKLTNQQHDHVPHTTAESNGELATIGRYLLGLCDLLAVIIETLRNFGKWLIGESQCGEPA